MLAHPSHRDAGAGDEAGVKDGDVELGRAGQGASLYRIDGEDGVPWPAVPARGNAVAPATRV